MPRGVLYLMDAFGELATQKQYSTSQLRRITVAGWAKVYGRKFNEMNVVDKPIVTIKEKERSWKKEKSKFRKGALPKTGKVNKLPHGRKATTGGKIW